MAETRRKITSSKRGNIQIFQSRGKRKRAIARVYIKSKGEGKILVNGLDWKVYFNSPFDQMYFNSVFDRLAKTMKNFDIIVNVRGGGKIGQLQAVVTGIARGLVKIDPELKRNVFDSSILKEDIRRVEPKKDRRRKARAKFQKSYR
ncbi:MAG: mitochondrial small ribosomal subunit protein uS9m [Candidatus Micrarchaeota archaeon]|nr:mitochondrial small ribosomal subunit protein uS9m [Candidatus Micrarchaeota archaeon]MCX8154286.1 mitochondrial small ribosomal subunit protein uS9m [Candidatus Micrarchaeota archaeon]